MRRFDFKAKIIGDEKYLTYTMGAETELDEDVLDYCEDKKPAELIDIIYEEDDDYDYLTYDVTGWLTINDITKKDMKSEKVLIVIRNIANNLIALNEQAIKLNYIILNKQFIYIDNDNNIKFICLPVESAASVVSEFKSFIRQLLANFCYDVSEDLNYVGKLLTYINGDGFNLRGLVGLTEALMEDAGITFEAAAGIEAEGVEVMNTSAIDSVEVEGVKNFMDSFDDADDTPLPEIGDDDEEEDDYDVNDDRLDTIDTTTAIFKDEIEEFTDDEEADDDGELTEAREFTVKPIVQEPAAKPQPATIFGVRKASDAKLADEEVLKNRIKAIAGDNSLKKGKSLFATEKDLDAYLDSKPPVIKKNSVKVNRAAIIQNIAASEEEAAAEEAAAIAAEEAAKAEAEATAKAEAEAAAKAEIEAMKPKSNSVLSKTVDASGNVKTNVVNIAKAIPYLIRVNTKEIIMLSKETFKIGKASRGVDYTVGGNGAISRQHAIIIRRDDVSYIKDNKSTNHTYVNGQMVEEGEEVILTHESQVRLGDEEFIFKIR